jgi:membrane fusion protein (multidrug efflux system)
MVCPIHVYFGASAIFVSLINKTQAYKMKTIFVKSTGGAIVLSLALLSGCTGRSQQKENDSLVKVRLETVAESNAVRKLDYVGRIEEKTSTALGFSTLGTIAKIYVDEGEYISPGQLLAKLDSSSARSMLDAAGASLKQAEDGFARLKLVHDKGSLTEVQMVDIETKLQQAKSSYNIAKKNLENCSLYAPAYGVVGKKMAEPGEYSMVGKAILTILDISSVKVRFSVPEDEISAIPLNCKSTVTVSALGNKKFEGKIIEKSVSANPVSHTYPVHITLPNLQKELLPGMVCKVELIPEGKPTGIVVPIGIIQVTADGRKYIWCEKDGKARRTIVTTGAANGNGVEITDGLSVGDRIVTEGYQKISEDDKITGK